MDDGTSQRETPERRPYWGRSEAVQGRRRIRIWDAIVGMGQRGSRRESLSRLVEGGLLLPSLSDSGRQLTLAAPNARLVCSSSYLLASLLPGSPSDPP